MLHIQPILEKDASPELQEIYKDIRETLGVPTVPLIFCYIGNFTSYVSLIWEQLKKNYLTDSFIYQRDMLVHATALGLSQMGEQPAEIRSYIQTLRPEERDVLIQHTKNVMSLNASLLLMLIAIRENVKGVYTVQPLFLSQTDYGVASSSGFKTTTQTDLEPSLTSQNADREIISVLGMSVVTNPEYTSFYDVSSRSFEKLASTQSYLVLRLFVEKQGVGYVKSWPSPLSLPYGDMITLIKTHPLFSELLYVLVDVFPTEFARLFLLSGYMVWCLEVGSSMVEIGR